MKCGDIVQFKSGENIFKGKIVGFTSMKDDKKIWHIYRDKKIDNDYNSNDKYNIHRDVTEIDIIKIIKKSKKIY